MADLPASRGGYLNLDAGVPQGFCAFALKETKFVVLSRYQNLVEIAKGTYGCVCKAYDIDARKDVAIKKLARPFQDAEIAKRTYRELKLLNHFEHENVLDLLDVFTPDQSYQTLNDLYLVTTAMECSLADVLNSNQLRFSDIPFIIYSILRGLKYIHGAGIIHRDLKPQNIGCSHDCSDVRILDFGLARTAETSMTGYVTTRWYRAPEIILNWMRYNQTADIWSVGCMMGEMLLGKPLFPGKCYLDQLRIITELLGTPTEDFVEKMTCDNARNYVRGMPKKKGIELRKKFVRANENALDALAAMLRFDPDQRPTAEVLLTYGYFGVLRVPSDEPVAEPIDIDETNTDVAGYRKLVWDAIESITNLKMEVS